MLINLRNALMAGKRLPYDAEVEFLESTGTQWIDTGVLLKFPISADMTLGMVSPYGTLDSLPVFGFRYGGGIASSKFAIWFNKSLLKFALNYGSYDSGYKNPTVQSGQAVNLRTDGARLYINGSLIADGGIVTTSDASNTLTLFQMRDTSSVANRDQRVRYYSCKIYDANGVLVRDFIPVRKGTVGYLYDRVTGALFGNAGTGDFVLGPDVVPVEYIESHGTEWIDTGLPGRDGYDFEYRFRPIGPLPLGIGGEYEQHKNCYIGIVRSNGYLAYNYFTPNNIVEVQLLTLGTDYNVKAHLYSSEQYFEVNGVRGGIGSRTGSFVSNYNLYLFAINNANSPTFNAVMRLHDFTANLNGVPVRKFRSIRVGTDATSWAGAMIDTLTRRIYRNAGTGAFTYGNDLKYPIPAE